MKSRTASCFLSLSLELQYKVVLRLPRGREPRPLRPTLCFPVQLRALLYRLREGADHVGRLCGCGRGTEEGAGLVSLMISEIRGNRGAFDVEDPGVHDLTVNLHHYFIILPIDHVIIYVYCW